MMDRRREAELFLGWVQTTYPSTAAKINQVAYIKRAIVSYANGVACQTMVRRGGKSTLTAMMQMWDAWYARSSLCDCEEEDR